MRSRSTALSVPETDAEAAVAPAEERVRLRTVHAAGATEGGGGDGPTLMFEGHIDVVTE
ncbi:hypothetical protein ACFC18_12045 [Streptomyces sp. NPDC056121]|uniref:hypothetical protein n=1 Tax=Streptomyces TaxID=1883 RepID=UPI001D0A7300|nr:MULTISPECIES: hypothetical protein [Streptomyces]MCX5080081.1 hypothetical protein [Streptomyces sp. NBC_00401]UDL98337.1 hypothetical protein LGI35_08765 [Streptomyces longhuiensis]